MLALGALGVKAWLSIDGPYLEALPIHDVCSDAEIALAEARVADALELADAGECTAVRAAAAARWEHMSAVAGRCWDGIWTGRGADDAAVVCAIASDLVVFGDVRDLTRQGVTWYRGDETDTVLTALSVAGVALTFAPGVGAGTSLLKIARRTGTLTRGLSNSVTVLVRERAWRPLSALLGDAGRMSRTLGPARSARALAYADTPAELATLARFVETTPHAMLALRWGGKSALRIGDDALYRTALARGPSGIALAAERGAAAMLSRKPFVVFAAKSIYKHPDTIAAWSLAFATWLLRWATWSLVLGVAATLMAVGLVLLRSRVRSSGRRGRGDGASQRDGRAASVRRGTR